MASYLSSKYVKKFGEHILILIGARLLVLAPMMLLTALLVTDMQIIALIIVLSIAIGFSATGLIIPNAYSLGVKSSAKIAGMASAFFGFAQMFGGCLYSYFMSMASSYSIIPLLMAMIVSCVIAVLCVSNFKQKSKLLKEKAASIVV